MRARRATSFRLDWVAWITVAPASTGKWQQGHGVASDWLAAGRIRRRAGNEQADAALAFILRDARL